MPDDFKPSQYEEHKKNIGNKRKKSEEEELKKNKDFAQLYTHNIDVIIQLIALNRLAGEILLLFIKFMQKNNTIIIEQKEIQAILNIKRRASVSEAIKYLVDNGYVARYKYRGIYVYFVNPYIASNTDAMHKAKLCKSYNSLWKDVEKNATINVLSKPDTNIVNTELYKEEDKLVMRSSFYKEHTELQPMTEEETTAYLQENKKKDINYKLSQLEGDELEAVCMEMIEETEKNIKKQIEEAYS